MIRGLRYAAAGLAVALVLSGCGGDEAAPVDTAVVSRATVREVIEAPASVAAKASANVTAPARGTVGRLDVANGERVKAGEVLLRIDSPEAQSQLDSARRAHEQASATGSTQVNRVDLSSQQKQLDRAAEGAFRTAREAAEQLEDPEAKKQQLANVAASEAQYQAASRQSFAAVRSFNSGLGSLASALGSLSQAQRVQTSAALALAERTVASLTVRAPISGVVSFGDGGGGGATAGGDLSGALEQLPDSVRDQAGAALGGGGGSSTTGALAVGTPVSTGVPLLAVTDTSSLALTAEVDETDVLLVKKGVEADVELDAVPGATYGAKVTSVDVSSTGSGRGGVTYSVRLALGGGTTEDGSPAPRPRPGMSAVADLKVREAKDAVSAPASAVFRDGRRDAVWVVADGVARKRLVRLGTQGEDSVEILEGLQPGDRVVVRGADTVTEGQQLP